MGALAGGGGLLALHVGRLRHGDLLFAGSWVAIALASLALNPALWGGTMWRDHGGEYATSMLVFAASLAMAFGVWTALRLWSADALARMAAICLALILAGVVAERFLGLDTLSEAVRSALYAEDLTYAADLRDRLIYGSIRPKLFTSEPSHIAKFFVLMVLVWYATSRSPWRVPWLYAWLAGGVLLVQSPSVLIALPAAWMADICRRRSALGWLVAVGGILLVTPLALILGDSVFSGRMEHIASGQDTSFLIRFVLPFEVLARVWSDYPLFGLGFGAKESGIPYTIAAAQDLGLDVAVLLTTTSPLGNNGLAIGLIQLGVVGSLAFIASLVAFWRFACGGFWPFVAIGMLCYLLLIGGVNDPRFWGGFALLTAAGAVAQSARRLPHPASVPA